MPRRYTLGKRTAQKAATRARIVAATLDAYRELGADRATVKEIASRADVAPATVVNHFPGPDDLAEAAVELVLAQLRPPTPEMFAGMTSTRRRIELLARELTAFFVRSDPWWRIYDRDRALSQVWARAEVAFYESLDGLIRAALGPLADDETAVSIVWAVIGPPVYIALRGRGVSPDEVAQLSADLVVPWLEARRRPSRKARGHK